MPVLLMASLIRLSPSYTLVFSLFSLLSLLNPVCGQYNITIPPSEPSTQELLFPDGFRVSIPITNIPEGGSLQLSIEKDEGINPGTLNANIEALNTFTWVLRSTTPYNHNTSTGLNATMSFPFNRTHLALLHPSGSSPTTMLQIGRRPLNATSGTFLPFLIDQQEVRELPEDRIVVRGVSRKMVEGRFLMMVTRARNLNYS